MRKGKENDEYDDNEYTLYLVHEGGQPEKMSKQSSEIGTYTVRYSFFWRAYTARHDVPLPDQSPSGIVEGIARIQMA